MTKKAKILNLFDAAEWIHGTFKIITYSDFKNAGLQCNIEYGETYCDVIYAQRIFKKMGYRTGVGAGLYIYKNEFRNGWTQ